MTPEQVGRAVARLDGVLVGLVLLLAFLVSLFSVHNSDFWLHLATGRFLAAQGLGAVAAEPFSYTANPTWVNHSWLYDLLAYAAFQAVGGPGLIVLKALLLTALAGLMLGVRRRGLSPWIPAACTALAVLAMSPRLLFQPMAVSFLFLGVTFYLLTRREGRAGLDAGRRAPAPSPWLGGPDDRRLWLLPPLFALWVNLDAWFFVGPLAVALYLAGEVIQDALASRGVGRSETPGAWRPLALVLVAGTAACLLNPYGAGALRLPAELSAAAAIAHLRGDPLFGHLFVSPWQDAYFQRDARSLAGAAYYPLVLLGAASFALNTAGWRWGRALTWAGFLALSSYYARAVPFFAVVAGPVAALNLQEWAARRFGTEPRAAGAWKAWSLAGRGASVAAGLALVLLAWPGWLHGAQGPARRVSLVAEPDPAIVEAAGVLRRWRQEGRLPEGARGLNLTPEVANVMAWVAPEAQEKAFFDYRLGAYPPEVAGQYVRLRRAFDPRPVQEQGASGAPVPQVVLDADDLKVLRSHGITHVILFNPEPARLVAPVTAMQLARNRWRLLHQNGHIAIFGLIDPPLEVVSDGFIEQLRAAALPLLPLPVKEQWWRPTGFEGLEYDPTPLAFGAKAEPLPKVRPPLPDAPRPWTAFLKGRGTHPLACDDAFMSVLNFNNTIDRWHYERFIVPWAGAAPVGKLGLGALPADCLGTRLSWAMGLCLQALTDQPPLPARGPLAPALLAVRSARKAILENPEDPQSYMTLAEGYKTLLWKTDEGAWARRLPPLGQLRQAQIAAALHRALTLDPDLEAAHVSLFEFYNLLSFKDLAVKELGEVLRLRRKAGPRLGEAEKAYDDRLKKLEQKVKEEERLLTHTRNDYAVKAASLKVLQKAHLARSLGLAETALEVLLGSDSSEFQEQGIVLEMELLLLTGRTDDLRRMIAPEDEDERAKMASLLRALGGVVYETYRMRLAAAEGDYEEADHFCEEAGGRMLTDPGALVALRQSPFELFGADRNALDGLGFRELAALDVSKFLLYHMPDTGPPLVYPRARRRQMAMEMPGLLSYPLQQQANFEALRGLLAIEAGDREAARRHFREALFRGSEQRKVTMDFGGLPAAARYLELIESND
jgi:tetratricopeptide (TPR) repeat protein